MRTATPTQCCAGIALLTVAVVMFARGDVDPTGTYGYRYTDHGPAYYTVVIRPMRGGWSTTWADTGGRILWRGTLTRLPGGRFLEHWRSGAEVGSPPRQIEWLAEGGYLVDMDGRTAVLEPRR